MNEKAKRWVLGLLALAVIGLIFWGLVAGVSNRLDNWREQRQENARIERIENFNSDVRDEVLKLCAQAEARNRYYEHSTRVELPEICRTVVETGQLPQR